MRVSYLLICAALAASALFSAQAGTAADWAACKSHDDPDAAITACTALIEAKTLSGKTLSDAYFYRAVAFEFTNRYQRAIDDLDNAIGLNPKNELAFDVRGFAFCRLSQCARAIDDFNRAIALNPKFANAYFDRGMAKQRSGDPLGSVEDIEMAKQLDPRVGN